MGNCGSMYLDTVEGTEDVVMVCFSAEVELSRVIKINVQNLFLHIMISVCVLWLF